MIYRKRGSVVRWENGTIIRVTENGAAREEGEFFECWPEPGRRVVESSSRQVVEVAQSLRHLPVERLIVSHGVAEHEYDGRTWREESERIHLSLAHGHLRALVDSTTRRLDDWNAIAEALQRAEQQERDAPARLRLAAGVAAALLPHLAGRAGVVQTAGGVDGYGHPIVEAEGDWPNVYRPSYRVRPVRMPLNLRLECDRTDIDEDAPRAVALLAPVEEGPLLRVLVADGGRVYPARVRVGRIEAAAREREWYPYGGGSFGAELML